MKLLKLYTVSLLLTAGLFAQQQDEPQLLDTTGLQAIEDLEVLLGDSGPKEDGSNYVIDNIFELPDRVKPGAKIKIKKITHAKNDPDTKISIESIEDMGTTTYSLSQDDGYFIITFPNKNADLEYEIKLNMRTTAEKLQIYKYWVYAHTFEVQQPNEEWIF